jgi:hypothetical protein
MGRTVETERSEHFECILNTIASWSEDARALRRLIGSNRYGYDANYPRGRIIGALGGMAAEEEVLGVVTTGSESDLEVVTRIARSMVGRCARAQRFNSLGPVGRIATE